MNIVLFHNANTYTSYVYLMICENISEGKGKGNRFLMQQNENGKKKNLRLLLNSLRQLKLKLILARPLRG